ncbi:MAG: ribonuclease HI [Methylococcus sp.]
MTLSTPVMIYTDGACRGNPGPGGWGALLRYGKKELEIYGGDLNTTNNRMELMAAIQSLQVLKRPCKAIITTDSIYVMKGITEWLPRWIGQGWRTSSRQPVKNADLWHELIKAGEPHEVEWRWVKGHAGHSDNERADRLANQGLEELLKSPRS